jgi:hypothetical protein
MDEKGIIETARDLLREQTLEQLSDAIWAETQIEIAPMYGRKFNMLVKKHGNKERRRRHIRALLRDLERINNGKRSPRS